MKDSALIVSEFYAAIEAGCHGEDIERFLAADACTREHPNAFVPEGRLSDRAAMLAGSTAGARLLSRQRYDIHCLRQIEDTVVTRLTWHGIVAHDAGSLRRGQELIAHIAQFLQVRDGRIARIETYDCYEPLVRPDDTAGRAPAA
jgi:ketosteroid isomerase-like protein